MPTNIKASMQFITKLIESGEFEPMIDRTYALEDIAEAFKYVMTGQKVGNVVVRI